MFFDLSGGGAPWQCRGETKADGGSARGEEPGTAQSKKHGT